MSAHQQRQAFLPHGWVMLVDLRGREAAVYDPTGMRRVMLDDVAGERRRTDLLAALPDSVREALLHVAVVRFMPSWAVVWRPFLGTQEPVEVEGEPAASGTPIVFTEVPREAVIKKVSVIQDSAVLELGRWRRRSN